MRCLQERQFFCPQEPCINRKSTRLSLWSAFFSCQGTHQRCKSWVETSQVVLDKVRELTTKLTTCNWESTVMYIILCASSCSFPSPKQNRNTERKRNFAFSIMENTQGPVPVLCFLFHHLLCPSFSLPARKSPWPVGPPPITTKVKSRFRSWPSVGRTAACAQQSYYHQVFHYLTIYSTTVSQWTNTVFSSISISDDHEIARQGSIAAAATATATATAATTTTTTTTATTAGTMTTTALSLSCFL